MATLVRLTQCFGVIEASVRTSDWKSPSLIWFPARGPSRSKAWGAGGRALGGELHLFGSRRLGRPSHLVNKRHPHCIHVLTSRFPSDFRVASVTMRRRPPPGTYETAVLYVRCFMTCPPAHGTACREHGTFHGRSGRNLMERPAVGVLSASGLTQFPTPPLGSRRNWLASRVCSASRLYSPAAAMGSRRRLVQAKSSAGKMRYYLAWYWSAIPDTILGADGMERMPVLSCWLMLLVNRRAGLSLRPPPDRQRWEACESG